MGFFNSFRLKMRQRRDAMPGKEEFTQAAVAYLVAKSAIIIGSDIHTSCADCGAYSLLRQGVHLVLFTHFIYAGMRITSSIIAAACIVRGAAYMANSFFGTAWLMSLPLTGGELVSSADGSWRLFMFVNALLLFLVAGMIMRAVKARGFGRAGTKEISTVSDTGSVPEGHEAGAGIRR